MGKRYIPPVQADRVGLRLLEERDLPRTLAWRNQEHIRRWFFDSEPLTLERHAAWFARYRERDDDFVFLIEAVGIEAIGGGLCAVPKYGTPRRAFTTDAARPVGQAALYRVDWDARRAEFGRLMIGEADAAGRGLAREATAAILNLAFGQLGLREVHLEVIPSNVRAIAVYSACGFEISEQTEKAVTMRKQRAA